MSCAEPFSKSWMKPGNAKAAMTMVSVVVVTSGPNGWSATVAGRRRHGGAAAAASRFGPVPVPGHHRSTVAIPANGAAKARQAGDFRFGRGAAIGQPGDQQR